MKLNTEEGPSTMAFRCKPELRASIKALAEHEGLTAGAVVRRAMLFDLRARGVIQAVGRPDERVTP